MNRYRRGHLLLACVALLLGPLSRGEAPRPAADDVEQLIRQLGSDRFEERDAAAGLWSGSASRPLRPCARPPAAAKPRCAGGRAT